jgi:hypothetical protein
VEDGISRDLNELHTKKGQEKGCNTYSQDQFSTHFGDRKLEFLTKHKEGNHITYLPRKMRKLGAITNDTHNSNHLKNLHN